MGKIKDISGQKFGRLTVLYRLHNHHKKHTYWLCVCECGNLVEVYGNSLKNGNTKSCGCLHKETISSLNCTHHKSNVKLYKVWNAMKQRCHNKNNKRYKDYGGRGIAVCSEWKDDFMSFYNWALSNGYKDNLTIDRINNNGNYEPNNCRLVDKKQQARNRRSNITYTINGETKCIADWCNILGLKQKTVYQRIHYYNWTIRHALELDKK